MTIPLGVKECAARDLDRGEALMDRAATGVEVYLFGVL